MPFSVTAQTIMMSPDPGFSGCIINEPPLLVNQTFYVGFWDNSSGLGGITGAEYRVTGLPAGYIASATANPAAIFIGDPLGNGTNIAFSECQGIGGFIVPLLTIEVLRFMEETEPLALFIEARSPPANPFFDCSLVTLCDNPAFTKLCVPGNGVAQEGGIVPDPSDPFPANGATNVETGPTTLSWGIQGPLVCCGLGVELTTVWFGTTADPPILFHFYDDPPYEVDLQPNTTYYWQVAWTPDTDCAGGQSPVWSFTTEDGPIAVEGKSWSEVKGVFR